jgi:hypothetical protein
MVSQSSAPARASPWTAKASRITRSQLSPKMTCLSSTLATRPASADRIDSPEGNSPRKKK